MRIAVLMENTAKESFLCEHGLSLYIECLGKKILFDTGAGPGFAENAAKLGIDLAEVDIAVISHGHNDHGGGIRKFMELNDKAPIYVAEEAFGRHYNAELKEISIDGGILASGRVRLVKDVLEIAPGMQLSTQNKRPRPYYNNNYGLQRLVKGQLLPDSFEHEIYLSIEENGKRIVFSGCSHKGILNVVDWLRPDIVVGGFHFFKLDVSKPEDIKILDNAAEILKVSGAKYYTCHCTGLSQFDYLSKQLDNVEYISAGTCLEL